MVNLPAHGHCVACVQSSGGFFADTGNFLAGKWIWWGRDIAGGAS